MNKSEDGRASKAYLRGLIFVDAATGHIHIKFHTFNTAEETVTNIKKYKQLSLNKGIIIKEYQSNTIRLKGIHKLS